MRSRIKRVLSILLPLLSIGLTMAIVGSYAVSVYAGMDADTAVKETFQGFVLVMPPEIKRALRIGGAVIIISIVAGFIGFTSADQ